MNKLASVVLITLCILNVPEVSAQAHFVIDTSTSLQHPNLVPNPSFEDHTGCPNNQDQLYMADHWFNAWQFNPDYFNSCSSSSTFGVPYNFNLSYQLANTGDAYAGISIVLPDVREYLGVQLNEALKPRCFYRMGFYISCWNNTHLVVDQFGALVTKNNIQGNISSAILDSYTPQVSSPKGQVLDDTVQWVLVSGIFKAEGGERFLTIGNFVGNNALTIVHYFGWPAGYYYIDDVFVNEIDLVIDITELPEVGLGIDIPKLPAKALALNLYPNPARENIIVKIPEILITRQLDVDVLNSLGQVIRSEPVPLNQQTWRLNTGTLPEGMYLLILRNNARVVGEGKFVVNR
jgi:hypothetical protein